MVTLVEYARRKKLYDPLANALASTLNYEKNYFDKLVASLLPLMEKLTTGRIASLLSPAYDDPMDWRPVFDWTSVINLCGIVTSGWTRSPTMKWRRQSATLCSPT